MNRKKLPPTLPINTPPTYSDQLAWYEDRIGQLEAFAVDLIQDRIALSHRCQ